MACDIERIHALFRHCAVASNAVYRNAEQRAARHKRAASAQNQSGRRARIDVQRKACLRCRVFQHARREHGLRAGKALLVRLKHQLDRAVQLILVLAQQLCRTEQHRRVHVVAAGVHAAVRGCKIQSGLLGHAQRVHVGAQEQTAAGLGAGYLRDDAACQLARLIAHLQQAFFDAGYGVRQVGADLGCSVQRPPVADNILSDALCRRKHLLRRYG